jgi:D-glycero-D-manno-heptose 1,7-bisphosphate phosphatase
MNRAAFLDRDGVINRKAPKGEYITRWEQLEFLPGVVDAVVRLKQAGFLVIVITNQRCVAKGQITVPELESLHNRMSKELARAGAEIDAIYYCPHEKQPVCSCRKPAPGMLLRAAREFDIDLSASWMIGDSEIDTQAGKNAGCRTARLVGVNEIPETRPDATASSLLEAVHGIVAMMRCPAHSP